MLKIYSILLLLTTFLSVSSLNIKSIKRPLAAVDIPCNDDCAASMSCTVCTDAVVYIQANPFESYNQVSSYLKNDCKSYGTYSQQCVNILNKSLPQIYDEAHHPWLTANDICNTDLQLCNGNK